MEVAVFCFFFVFNKWWPRGYRHVHSHHKGFLFTIGQLKTDLHTTHSRVSQNQANSHLMQSKTRTCKHVKKNKKQLHWGDLVSLNPHYCLFSKMAILREEEWDIAVTSSQSEHWQESTGMRVNQYQTVPQEEVVASSNTWTFFFKYILKTKTITVVFSHS